MRGVRYRHSSSSVPMKDQEEQQIPLLLTDIVNLGSTEPAPKKSARLSNPTSKIPVFLVQVVFGSKDLNSEFRNNKSWIRDEDLCVTKSKLLSLALMFKRSVLDYKGKQNFQTFIGKYFDFRPSRFSNG